jgi:hypothetical protein
MGHIKKEYHLVKNILMIATLVVSVWALVVAYQAKSLANWVDNKQNNLIEQVLFEK